MATIFPPGVAPSTPAPQSAAPDNSISWGPQAGTGLELNSGEQVLSPNPATPRGALPQWPNFNPPQQPSYQAPQYQQQPVTGPPAPPAYQYPQGGQQFAPPQQQQQPPAQFQIPQQQLPQQPPAQFQYPPQPQYQQPVAPQAPAAQPPNWQQFALGPDPARVAAAGPHQFNDGLQLGGRIGGGNTPVALGGPPVAQAPDQLRTPQGVPVQGLSGVPNTGLAPTAGSTALRDSLVAGGLPVGHYGSDEALLADMGQTVQQVNQLRAMARIGYETLEQRQTQAGQPAPVQPQQLQQPQAPPAPKSSKPEWKSEWGVLVRKDPATGRFVAAAEGGVNPLIVERANELEAWQRERAQKLVNDPVGLVLEDGLEARFDQKLKAAREEWRQESIREEQARAAQQQVQSFMTENRAAFFALDQQGQPLVNNITGQPVLTQVGQAAFGYGNQYAHEFEAKYGVSPQPADVISYVQMRLRAEGFAQPQQPMLMQQPQYQQPGMTPQRPSPQDLKDQVLHNAMLRAQAVTAAAHTPNQAGTIAAAAQNATQPQNTRMSFQQMLIQDAIQKGSLPPNYVQFAA
jgi:hypothetical protein